jgi:hypothetical protein
MPLTPHIRPQQAKPKTFAYLERLTSRVVCYLCERVEKMINCRFALEADGMEELEGDNGDGALGVIRRHGKPTVREQLLPAWLTPTTLALAKVHGDVVKPVQRYHHKFVMAWVSVRARSVVGMPKLDPQPEVS